MIGHRSFGASLHAPSGKRRGGDEFLPLDDAAVAEIDAAITQFANDMSVEGPHRIQIDRPGQPSEIIDIGDGQRRSIARSVGPDPRLQQRVQRMIADRLDEMREQETVGEGLQRAVLGQAVRGRDAAAERDIGREMATPELALIQNAEQRIEDRGRAEEDLVEKGDIGLGKHAGDVRPELPLAQSIDVKRAENLRRLGEPADQIFKIAPADMPRGLPRRR